MSLKPNKIVKAIRNGAAAGALGFITCIAHAGADGPVVRGSIIEANAILAKVNVEGVQGKGTNAGFKVGVGSVGIGGSYGSSSSAQNAELHGGDISIQSGTVQGSTLRTNATLSEVAVKGASVTAATILVGK